MSHPFKHQLIGEILSRRGVLTSSKVDGFLKECDVQPIGQYLVENKHISSLELSQVLAEQSGLEYFSLEHLKPDTEVFSEIPIDLLYQYMAAPVSLEQNQLLLAVSNPYDLKILSLFEFLTGREIHLCVACANEIMDFLKRSEGESQLLKGVSKDFEMMMVVEDAAGDEKCIRLDSLDDTSQGVVKLINSILVAALQKNASDIHFEVYEQGIVIKYRIDGVLYPAVETLDKKHHSSLIARIKVMSELDIAEKRIPQDGRFKIRFKNHDIDFRVSILPGSYGEDVVIRVLDKSSFVQGSQGMKLASIGMPKNEYDKFIKSIHEPYGLILITGPTGSGKTTTLYSSLMELNSGDQKIITIEDPVEYQLDGIVQIAVNEKKELTFAKGLRSMLRHDPDKIMVGEIRDIETAKIAVQSALTGHLVLSTVHANNAVDVISRFNHMGVDTFDFVTSLNCVLAQRLVRKLCENCKQETQSFSEEIKDTSIIYYEAKGCDYCNYTGYKGRNVITELLYMTDEIKEMILNKKPSHEIHKFALENGMLSLRESAIELIKHGITSLNEINRVTFHE